MKPYLSLLSLFFPIGDNVLLGRTIENLVSEAVFLSIWVGDSYSGWGSNDSENSPAETTQSISRIGRNLTQNATILLVYIPAKIKMSFI